jgi:hypothetical protein
MTVAAQPNTIEAQRFISGAGSDKLNILVDAVNGMRQAVAPPRQEFLGKPVPFINARIDSSSGLDYEWAQVEPAAAGGWAVMPDGLTSAVLGPAKEMNGTAGLADGLLIRVFAALGDDGVVSYWFIAPAPGGMFPVKVQQTGGSNGTDTTAATYTYTVRTLAWNGTSGGETLGTGVALSRPREIGFVTVQAGSTGYGVAFYDGLTLRLWDAGEIYGTEECPEPE